MRLINNVVVKKRADGKWDFNIVAAENGKILSGSDQGYESREECRQIGVRCCTGTLGTITFDQDTETV